MSIRNFQLGQNDIWKQKVSGQLAYCKILQSDVSKQELNERSNWQHENVIKLLAAELHKENDKSYISIYYEFQYDSNLQYYLINKELPIAETEIYIFYNNGQIKIIEGHSYKIQQQLGLVPFEYNTYFKRKQIYKYEQFELYDE